MHGATLKINYGTYYAKKKRKKTFISVHLTSGCVVSIVPLLYHAFKPTRNPTNQLITEESKSTNHPWSCWVTKGSNMHCTLILLFFKSLWRILTWCWLPAPSGRCHWWAPSAFISNLKLVRTTIVISPLNWNCNFVLQYHPLLVQLLI